MPPSKSKIKDISSLKKIIQALKKKNKKVVFANGCFDILHRGHLHYLEKAKQEGDILIVAVNSDASVKKIKGKSRPINKEKDRADLIAGLGCVDYVIIFTDPTPYNLIKILKPDILVKGSDWKKREIVGRNLVQSNGGKVKTIRFIPGYSTTSLIKKIKLIKT